MSAARLVLLTAGGEEIYCRDAGELIVAALRDVRQWRQGQAGPGEDRSALPPAQALEAERRATRALREKLLGLLEQQPMSLPELVEYLQAPEMTIGTELGRLRELGLIERVEAKPYVRWGVVDG